MSEIEIQPKKRSLSTARRRAASSSDAAVHARRVLVHATIALMKERMGVGVSVAEIGARAGMNSALISYYFESKINLFGAVLTECLSEVRDNIEALRQLDLSATEKLRGMVLAIMEFFSRYPFVERLFDHVITEGREELAFGEETQQFVKMVTDFLATILDDGVAGGEFQPMHPMLVYYNIVGMASRIFCSKITLDRMLDAADIDRVCFDLIVEHSSDLILSGLKPR